MRRIVAAALVTFSVTISALLLLFNLTLGDKKIDYRIEAAYPVSDPQFLRTLGALLGPLLTGGNRAQALLRAP